MQHCGGELLAQPGVQPPEDEELDDELEDELDVLAKHLTLFRLPSSGPQCVPGSQQNLACVPVVYSQHCAPVPK